MPAGIQSFGIRILVIVAGLTFATVIGFYIGANSRTPPGAPTPLVGETETVSIVLYDEFNGTIAFELWLRMPRQFEKSSTA